MYANDLRNLCLLAGFAWCVDGRWLLLQREPLDVALPLSFAPDAPLPAPSEPIDLVGQIVPDGGLHVAVAWWARAAVTSFPPALRWRVRGVSDAAAPNLAGNAVVMPGAAVPEGDRNVSNLVRAQLQPKTAWPTDVVTALQCDPALAAWCEGTPYLYRLLNGVLMTGWVESVRLRVNGYVHPYHAIDLRTAAASAPTIPVRVGRSAHADARASAMLRARIGAPLTVVGRLTAKPVKDAAGASIGTTLYVEATRLLEPTDEDIQRVPEWALAREVA